MTTTQLETNTTNIFDSSELDLNGCTMRSRVIAMDNGERDGSQEQVDTKPVDLSKTTCGEIVW